MEHLYSVIVPVYRGERTISTLFEQCLDVFKDMGVDFEVVFVCDGARDNSWAVVQKLKNKHPQLVTGVRLSRNFGQHNAILCGFKHARGNYFFTMDEDLQHNPEDIPGLIARQKEDDYDVVYGFYKEKMHNPFRNFTSSILRKMIALSIPDVHPDYSPFRLIKAEIALKTLPMRNSYTFLDGYLSWITTHAASTHVKHSEGKAGKSSYTLSKLIDHSINIFVTFSHIPIRLLTWMSFTLFLLSGAYGAFMLFRKVVYNDLISGFATFAVLGGFGLGFLLLGMGILGEYIHRINLKTTQRPIFEERETI